MGELMRLRTSAMLGTGLLVAILLSVTGGGSTVNNADTLKNGPNYFTQSPNASATEYGLLVTPDATAIEYGLL
jgi:hypothetical protein